MPGSDESKRSMKMYGKQCPACPSIKEGKYVKLNKSTWTISSYVNCESSNIIYLIECHKKSCNERYIGENWMPLKERVKEHVDYIGKLFATQATGQHFNLPRHKLGNMTKTSIKKAHKYDDSYRQKTRKVTHKKMRYILQWHT